MTTQGAEVDFSTLQFEKTLTNLKDSQESINQCCQWCLVNRQHYKKIVTSWLNVIKRVKIEQRLTLFYLANDVVQYSKRRNYEYIDTWGTAIQKATTMVRDEKVKHKILRIFKIWEQRGVYGEEFIADLCGLISVQPSGPKNDEPHEFQSSYVINKIKNCANLEKDTDTKLKVLKEHNPKIQVSEGLTASLKDRVHVDDVEKELDVYVEHMENYINALKLEIKNRIALISVLKQAETQLESDRKDVKTVAHAYKAFGQRLKTIQKRLEEKISILPSPVPSPDINAPSPGPEEDLELPDEDSVSKFTDLQPIRYTNPGFYVPPPTSISSNKSTGYSSNFNRSFTNSSTNASFLSNGFTSFLGQNISFDVSNISTTGLFPNDISTGTSTQTTNSYVTSLSADTQQTPDPVTGSIVDLTSEVDNNHIPYNPLLPPPMPPFAKNGDNSGFNFNSGIDITTTNSYESIYTSTNYTEETLTGNAQHYNYQTQSSSYDPSRENWENDNQSWGDMKELDTPESPPIFEKKGYAEPVEYHDSAVRTGAVDVDHRVLPSISDLEDSNLNEISSKDIDHRNLISLTGSPNTDTTPNGTVKRKSLPARGNLKTITPQDTLWDSDHDYRTLSRKKRCEDQDYRIHFNLKPPPPPPPPPKSPLKKRPPPPPPLPIPGTPGDPRLRYNSQSPRKGDIVGDVDMDLSDDLETPNLLSGGKHLSLEPPPPLPELLDDVDANQFLDEINNDLNEFTNLSGDLNVPNDHISNRNSEIPNNNKNLNMWTPLQPPPPIDFAMGSTSNVGFPPGMSHPSNEFMMPMNSIDMTNPPPLPGSGLLLGQMPPPSFQTRSSNWMDESQPPSWGGSNEDQYLNNDELSQSQHRFRNNGFRGGGRGRGWNDRGSGRGSNRGSRGHFRSRGLFRGRGR
ncbi:hypothetical protein ABEB36_002429 [Hypothenemus hampei]|uniref:CID domain-containing protein n=1 Tax=Hypothenemus hampei TaxID=57062 RepID=A0ABD1F7D9_HYPHA